MYDILLADVRERRTLSRNRVAAGSFFINFFLFALHHVQRRISMHQDSRAGGGHMIRQEIRSRVLSSMS